MGDALASRHDRVSFGDTAAKQHLEAIHGAFWRRAQAGNLSQVGFMLDDQLLEAQMYTAKGLIVRWQDEHIGRQESLQLRTGIEPLLERIGFRFGGKDAHIRRYPRQDLIA